MRAVERRPTANTLGRRSKCAHPGRMGGGRLGGHQPLSGWTRLPGPGRPAASVLGLGGHGCRLLLGRLVEGDVLGGDRLLGHQIRRPTSRFSAVTSTERTTKVSSRTPKATATPISVTTTSGRVPRAAKVPASTIPGRGDHPAGGGQADQGTPPGPVAHALLADPGLRKMLSSVPNATRNTKVHR
jgi:hypothetical protein